MNAKQLTVTGIFLAVFFAHGSPAQVLETREVTPRAVPPVVNPDGEGTEAPVRQMNPGRERRAPEGSAPPLSNPRDFSGVWVSRVASYQTVPQVKPELEGRVQTPQPTGFGTPNMESRKCHPSPYFNGLTSYPMQIFQTEDQVTFVFEENRRIHRIHLNAELPDNPVPAHYGHSVGYWEGDTLVVETIGLKHTLDYLLEGDPNIRVIEDIRKIEDGSVLEIKITYRNDAEWETPGTMIARYDWRPDLTLFEVICEEFSDAYGRGYDELR